MDVVKEMQTKISNLSSKKNHSIWPVLIHVNGVTQGVLDSGFFSRIIDFSNLLIT